MFHKYLLLTTAVLLLSTAQVQAWGAAHVGYTHVGPGGVQHYGHTTEVGPYGAYSGSHYGSTTGGGGAVYHTGSTEGVRYGAGGAGAYHYNGASGYQAGGFGSASVTHTESTGVYRRY